LKQSVRCPDILIPPPKNVGPFVIITINKNKIRSKQLPVNSGVTKSVRLFEVLKDPFNGLWVARIVSLPEGDVSSFGANGLLHDWMNIPVNMMMIALNL